MSVKIKHIVRLAAALLLTASGACSEDPGIDGGGQLPSGAVLRLTTGSSVTRGDGSSDPYAEGEEAIGRVDLFFFENATTDKAPFYTLEIADVKRVTTADLTVKVPVEHIATFKTNDVYIHALVNLPRGVRVDEAQNTIDGRSATLANLQSLWVEEGGFVGAGVPAAFVMRGGSDELELTGEGRLALVSGTIMLERLASKVRLWAEIPEELYVDRETGKTINRADYDSEQAWQDAIADTEKVRKWQPVPTTRFADGSVEHNVKLYLYNLTTRGRLDGFLGSADEMPDLGYRDVDRSDERADAVRRLVSGDDLILNEADRDDRYAYSHTTAYYSYPNAWDSSTPTEQHRTYVVLALPWRDVTDGDAGSDFENYYYQIPVNALRDSRDAKEADRLEPNRYYRIKLRVGMLGSKDLGSPLEIDASCEVADWTNADVDVRIKPRRYLVVNQKNWTMNNVSTLEIPFSTSHRTKIEACYVTYFRYNDPWGIDTDSREPASDNSYDTTDGTITEWKSDPNSPTGYALNHNKQEFNAWLEAAKGLDKGQLGEGLITADFDNKTGDVLYYQQKYFYDNIYNGYRYYVGREQPKTFKETIRHYNNGQGMSNAEKEAWKLYNLKYNNLNAVYDCTIDTVKNVINFSHPLIQWQEVRDGQTEGTGSLKYYVPLVHPRIENSLWDEFSRCEIIIKIRHEDWNYDDDLYEETIYITQYPAVYVEVSHNYGSPCTFDLARRSRGNEYLRVNGNPVENLPTFLSGSYKTEWFEAGRWVEYFGLVNNNPNMYVIHSTQLSEDNEALYDLGDPRTLYYNNILDNNSFENYKHANTANGSTPLRWSNGDNRPSRGTGSLYLYETQDKDYQEGPAWWTSREFASTTGLLYFYYRNYNLSFSLYPEFKPENPSSNIPTDSREWNGFINHKNNLCYYYPTDESTGIGSKANFIAPVFRIASSFGKVTLTSNRKYEARRRCATYQEAGRPAGRWRIPTRAEVEYMVQLSNDHKIPMLFGYPTASSGANQTAYYWTANGSIGVTVTRVGNTDYFEGVINEGDESSTDAVRCVYDEWYWTQVDGTDLPTPDGVLETSFYWGDRPKDNTQVQSLLQTATNKQKVIAVDE